LGSSLWLLLSVSPLPPAATARSSLLGRGTQSTTSLASTHPLIGRTTRTVRISPATSATTGKPRSGTPRVASSGATNAPTLTVDATLTCAARAGMELWPSNIGPSTATASSTQSTTSTNTTRGARQAAPPPLTRAGWQAARRGARRCLRRATTRTRRLRTMA